MTVSEVLTFFGGFHATAKALGIKQPSVSKWKAKKKIPYLRQLHIQQVTKGKLRAEAR